MCHIETDKVNRPLKTESRYTIRCGIPRDTIQRQHMWQMHKKYSAVRWNRHDFDDGFDGRYRFVRVVDERGNVAGYASYRVMADEAEILDVVIGPPDRHKGLGSRLVRRLCREAAQKGARSVFLETAATNQAACALYATCGFTPAGIRRGYFSGGLTDAVIMRKIIPCNH